MSGLVGASQVMMTQSQKMNGKYTHTACLVLEICQSLKNISDIRKYFIIWETVLKKKHLKTFYSLVYLVDNRENYNLSGVICSSQGLN